MVLDPKTVEIKTTRHFALEINNPITDPIKLQQIENFCNGNGMIVSIHIVHHAGTTLCNAMRQTNVSTPSFACMSDKEKYPRDAYIKYPNRVYPWRNHSETNLMISLLQPVFQFVSWEFSYWPNLHGRINWEHSNLVSMIVMRDPLERFLSRGKCDIFHTSIQDDPNPSNQDEYWKYANSNCSLNFAMRVLTEKKHGLNMYGASELEGEEQLASAKRLLQRFTLIIDQACFTDAMPAIGNELNLQLDMRTKKLDNFHHQHKPSVRERFANDTLYKYVKHRFRYDIALYEWAKTQSIVQCHNNNNNNNHTTMAD